MQETFMVGLDLFEKKLSIEKILKVIQKFFSIATSCEDAKWVDAWGNTGDASLCLSVELRYCGCFKLL